MQMALQSVFGAGELLLDEKEPASQKPAFGEVRLLADKLIDERSCFRNVSGGKKGVCSIGDLMRVSAQGRDFRFERVRNRQVRRGLRGLPG